jgi:hypothetical protein
MTTSTPPTIDLDGITFTGRKYTNALRASLGEAPGDRRRLRAKTTRSQLAIQRLQKLIDGGEATEELEDQFVGALESIRENNEQLEASAYELAPKLLADEAGKAPTKKQLDDHADPETLGTVVAIVLREETAYEDAPDPTPASTDEP